MNLGEMDDFGRLDTSIHRLDARAKTAATLLFIVAVMSFPRYALSALTPFALYPLALLSAGRIPARPILRKLLAAAPFALLVGLFNPLLDRRPVGMLGSWTLTGGWVSWASIFLRLALTVSAALALVACTGMPRLSHGLLRLGLPRMFVTQLLFLHRYLFVIANESATMRRAVELRSSGWPLRLRVWGALVGRLLVRSMDRADRVYRAMVARGFDGRPRLLHPTRFRWADAGFVLGWGVFFFLARRWNLAEEFGRRLIGVFT